MQHLSKRVDAFEKLAVKADAELPDFAAWTIGIVGLLFGFVLIESFREKNQSPEVASHAVSDALGENTLPRFNAVGAGCLIILLGYVGLLQFGVPFVIATSLGVFLVGATIAKWNSKRLFTLAQIALLFSLSLELIFTKVFTVALP